MSLDRFRIRVIGDHPLAAGETFLMDGGRSLCASIGERELIQTHAEKALRTLAKEFSNSPASIGAATTRVLAPGNLADFEADVGLMLACLGETLQVVRGTHRSEGDVLKINLGMPEDRDRGAP